MAIHTRILSISLIYNELSSLFVLLSAYKRRIAKLIQEELKNEEH